MKRLVLFSIIITTVSIFAQNSNHLEKVKVTRDNKGVWFISGADNASFFDTYEAMGYCVSCDRLWQAEKFRRVARGKLAEVFGTDHIQSDIYMRTIGYSDQELEQAFHNLNPEIRSSIEGYVAGFNRRISEIRANPKLLPFEFTALDVKLNDWTVEDVLAWSVALQRKFDPEATEFDQLDNARLLEELAQKFPDNFAKMFEDVRWRNDSKALTYIHHSNQELQQTPSGETLARYKQVASSNISKAARDLQQKRQEIIANQKKANAYVKMGSYAWVVSGKKTVSGNPILYSGPQMGFSVPAIILEGSIRSGGVHISGMTVAGLPGVIAGRTPHHAWSIQVGHAHTVDYYLESPANVKLHRIEVIKVKDEKNIELPVYRSSHGPIVYPRPYNPEAYNSTRDGPIVAWKYAHWQHELLSFNGWLGLARAKTIDEFAQAIEKMTISLHFTYADKEGNIAYWMSGRDPKRPSGEYRFPQPIDNPLEWDTNILRPRSTDRNSVRGYYSGWNNKSSLNYHNTYNNTTDIYGPFHRAHVIDDYLSTRDKFTFEEIRDLALNIATTDSFHFGGNPWKFVADDFIAAVHAHPTKERMEALQVLQQWDGHFVKGDWASGKDRLDGWVLMDRWIRGVIQLTFADEFATKTMNYTHQNQTVLFNVLLHGLDKTGKGIKNKYQWFQNADKKAPQSAKKIIVAALDKALMDLGKRPWGMGHRGVTNFNHEILGTIHTMPRSRRSTYAHIVEMGTSGPVRIESMFPLGESGTILMDSNWVPVFDKHFFGMTSVFDLFKLRKFPLFHK